MFGHIPELTMHRFRWLITIGWLLLIFSLFYDPISPILTHPNSTWSPFRIQPNVCIQVQGVCLDEQPYRLGSAIFWGIVVPSAIFMLLVFGHELWRRICPLSFLSQLPAALKWQQLKPRVDAKTGKTRYEIGRIKKESWLGRNHLYLQFGWLYLGLCARILLINSDRTALALWLLFTIGAAITVGYLYGGKSWCQYFCPMAPVQKIYAEPGGLLTSKAHMDEQPITQSMCRTIAEDGKEQSACVACKSPCIDIDAERSYWDGITRPDHQFIYYSYFGLVIGYFLYYYLYAGNWNYYFSGAWAHQEDQWARLFDPGFYLFNRPIAVPKLVAVPLTLGLFSGAGYQLGLLIERAYAANVQRHHRGLSIAQIQHHLFTFSTFLIFNIFFIFAGRSFLFLLPLSIQYLYDSAIVLLSTCWLLKTWWRSPTLYSRENLALRFRKQLSKLNLNVAQFLEGRTLDDLNTDEIYVLAKVLPGFTQEKRHHAYKGILRDALEEGYVNTSSSLEVLRQLRAELDISEEEHQAILVELGVEDPELLNPARLRNRENLVRLTGYRKALERIVTLQQYQRSNSPLSQSIIHDLLQDKLEVIRSLRQQYAITLQEETEILTGFDAEAEIAHRAEFLLGQLRRLVERYCALNQPILLNQRHVMTSLLGTIREQKRFLTIGLLDILETLTNADAAFHIAETLSAIGSTVLQELLEEQRSLWQERLHPAVLTMLEQSGTRATACSLELQPATIAEHLEALLGEPNPLIQASSLYVLYQLDRLRGQRVASQLLGGDRTLNPLMQETAQTILAANTESAITLAPFHTLEKLVYLFNSDFFNGVRSETLLKLAHLAVIKTYQVDDVVTEEGDTCRELLLLVTGAATIQSAMDKTHPQRDLVPGEILDELEVLSHTEQAGTIIAKATSTRILAIPVDAFDDLLRHDSNFARRVLQMESRRLQQLIFHSSF